MIKKLLLIQFFYIATLLPTNVFAQQPVQDSNKDSVQETVKVLEKGQGNLVENVVSGNREFFTITTENGSTYYLVIDKNSLNNNVYMLKAITDEDLTDFLPYKEINKTEELQEKTIVSESKEDKEETVSTEPTASNKGFSLIELGALALLIGLGVYFAYTKFTKLKSNPKKRNDFEEDEEDEEILGLANKKDRKEEIEENEIEENEIF